MGDMAVAEAISQCGVAPGTAVVSVGDGQVAYWAELARVSVVAEVWFRFWSAPARRAAGCPSLNGLIQARKRWFGGRIGIKLPARVANHSLNIPAV